MAGTTVADTPAAEAGLDRNALLNMYETMRMIRTFEDTLHDLFAGGGIPGFVHLYAGQEAVGTGVMAALKPDDFITSHHRGHGHCIAKGVDLNAMLAEIYGRSAGVCKGKGGSMHIADVSKGMLGANGIVGAGVPLAAGAALTAKTKKSGQVCVCFFSDGASNQGTFHEGVNLAAILKLPAVFVCENNQYAETTSYQYAVGCEHIGDRAASYGIPGYIIDGQDVVTVYQTAREAIDRARNGGGPSLIEAKTYRYYGHFEGDSIKYRTKDEVEEYRQRDPLKVFVEKHAADAGISADDMATIDKRVQQRMDAAIQFAQSSEPPAPEDCLTDVYVSY